VRSSRREFLKLSSAAIISSPAVAHARLANRSLHLPLGLQLYSVRDLLPKDYAGTLKEIGALGYREVEAAGYYNHSVAEIQQAMHDANLDLVSTHYSSSLLHQQLDTIVAFNKALGVRYIICSSPERKDPSRSGPLTLDDWRWNAQQLNLLGQKVQAAGFRFGYHNHFMEFRETDGVVPYDELLRLTEPSKVTMEMDCGWVRVGGGNVVDYLRKYPTRITMLHVKDFKSITDHPAAAELGQGIIDYGPIFREAARTGNVKHCFVEQEGFDMPPMEALKIDAAYMRKLGMG
jgi:sugar phosphate isomerase/epimerase